MNKGIITNEFNKTVGRYWFDTKTCSYTIKWHGIKFYGFTEKGLNEWALDLNYYLEEC